MPDHDSYIKISFKYTGTHGQEHCLRQNRSTSSVKSHLFLSLQAKWSPSQILYTVTVVQKQPLMIRQ